MSPRTLFIVTGLSGAGKSQVIHALEDNGFYCVDNLPIGLFPKFLELIEGSGGEIGSQVALGLDLREGALDERFPEIYGLLQKSQLSFHILFVEAADEQILHRFSETRRPHPLAPRGSVEEGIAAERARLEAIKEKADVLLDSTGLTPHQLRRGVLEVLQRHTGVRRMTINLVSFGYAHGLPPEASLVFDVRFLPNPHFVADLRPLTGEDQQVFDFVCDSPEGREFLGRANEFMRYLLPLYQKEGKAYLNIAVGCTGGRHRSVAVAKWLYTTLLDEPGVLVNLVHRDRAR